MLKYSLKRILLALITAFIILTLTFFLVKSLPFQGVVSPDVNTRWGYYINQEDLGYVIHFDTDQGKKSGDLLESFLNYGGEIIKSKKIINSAPKTIPIVAGINLKNP